MKRATVLILASVLLAGCSFFGVRSGYEQPAYEIVDRLGPELEVRRYKPRIAAEVIVAHEDDDDGQDAAFRVLFDYITGANRAKAKIEMTVPLETTAASERIAMTAPVQSDRTEDGRTRMRFFLPGSYDLATAPEPEDPRVRILRLSAQTIAVLRFSGFRGDGKVAAKTAELTAALEASPWRPAAAPMAYFYDPPWTLPFLRRNEVAVAVAK